MSATRTTVAAWLPPALRAAPDDDAGAPRLLDLLLLGVDRQFEALEEDIDLVWQDLFIESCSGWAVPYIGALLGLPPDAERAEVASAIALRRRKGTPAALEAFAEIVSGLTARVIEGWQVTVWAQRPGHPPPPRVSSFDMRDGSRFRIGSPFDRASHSITPSGRYSPRAAIAVLWPWQVRTYRAVEAAPLPEPARFALHPLGAEAPPYLRPLPAVAEDNGLRRRTGDELDAPACATYRAVQALATVPEQITYGTNWTVRADHPLAQELGPGRPALLSLTAAGAAVPWSALRLGSLPPGGPASASPLADEVVVDLARGHAELGSNFAAPVRATWHRPVPALLGALASDGDANPAARVVVIVNPALPATGHVVHTLQDAFAAGEALSAGLDPTLTIPGRPDVEIRLESSDRLAAPPPQAFTPTLRRWRILAPRTATPTVTGDLELDLEHGCLSLEGFALAGDLELGKRLDGVELRHLTMDAAGGTSLLVEAGAWGLSLAARRCILGAIRADLGAFPIDLSDCIVDGHGAALRVCGGSPGGSPRDAVARRTTLDPALDADGVTFAGPVRVESADAVDCLFADGIEVVQQQEGCLRHCYLGPDLSTPPSHPATYRCGPFPAPTFASIGFEAAGYYAIELEPEHPLLSAGSDGGEVGAYHHLRRAARIERLRRRIHEFVPLGLRPGVALAPWEE